MQTSLFRELDIVDVNKLAAAASMADLYLSYLTTLRSMDNLQTEESLVDEDRRQISLYNNLSIILLRYVLIIPVFGGLVANVLCLLTLQMSSFRECAAGFLLSALTVVDMASLAVGGIHSWIFGTFDFDLRQLSIHFGRVHLYLTYLTVHLSAWTLALITLERLVVVTRPLQVAWLCTTRRMALAWIIITITLALTDLYIPLSRDRVYVTNTTTNASVATDFVHFNNSKAIYWMDMCISFFAPFTAILCGNCTILYMLFEKRNQKMTRSVDPKTHSITVMLLMASLMFVVTCLPINIYFLGLDTFFPSENHSELADAKLSLIVSVMFTLYYFNNAGNFLLYMMSGPRFRNAFINIFCCKRRDESSSVTSNKYISETVSKRQSAENNEVINLNHIWIL